MEASAVARSRVPQLAKYEVLEEIGHGGMATVYRALDRRLGREVALKVIHPHLRDSREVVARFNAEARAVAKLRHPNIVEVFDVSEPDDEEQYLVVELLRGTTLRKLLQEKSVMPPEVAAAVALELLGALEHANAAGVVHRDVKPENVMLEHRPAAASLAGDRPAQPPSGDRVVVKLTDFGIAKLLDAESVTSTGQVLGSPAHMAPEQIEGGDVDARADVFGMGVLLYECMVGHLPFEGSNPAQVLRRVLDGHYPEAQMERPVIGNRWGSLLDRALAHSPADRFSDADAMREAVTAELDRLGVSQPKRELEAWLDDPPAYVQAHGAQMVEKLCALASEARKRGDSLAAAADYNRALAHAPGDPRLLGIVAGMNRAEARARLMRRATAVLLLMVGLGLAAFGLGRLVQARRGVDRLAAMGAPAAAASARMAPSASATLPFANAGPSASASPHAWSSGGQAAQRVVERSLQLDLTPSMGVKLSIDGDPTRDVASGYVLRLDGKAHVLAFTCSFKGIGEVCVPVERQVATGEKDETLVVRLPIKPATLVIEGDQDKTYQLVEHPEIPVRVGTNTVTLRSAFESVTVKQIESNTAVPVRLQAGKPVQATF
jgi:tRNA A-37 threonylcarbamoyl transferase component Bud32